MPLPSFNDIYYAGSFRAFHNDPARRAQVLAEVDAHVASDSVTQGTYGDPHGAFFIRYIASAIDRCGFYDRGGFPMELTRVCENIIEELPEEDCPSFFRDVFAAPSLGADLSLVVSQFLRLEVEVHLELFAQPEVRRMCAGAINGLERRARGVLLRWSDNRIAEAAAKATQHVANSDAAIAARYVHTVAGSAIVSHAARIRARRNQAARLIGLLKAAPIPSETKKEG